MEQFPVQTGSPTAGREDEATYYPRPTPPSHNSTYKCSLFVYTSHTHTYTHTYTHRDTHREGGWHTATHTHTRVCVCVCVCVCQHTLKHTHTQTHRHTHACVSLISQPIKRSVWLIYSRMEGSHADGITEHVHKKSHTNTHTHTHTHHIILSDITI